MSKRRPVFVALLAAAVVVAMVAFCFRETDYLGTGNAQVPRAANSG